jgi:long-chain acyl-CoA synthetase
MDLTPYLDLRPAPHAVFSRLPERQARPRFMVQAPGGTWRAVTWAEYARDVRYAARFLDSVGLRSGERAAIYAANSVAWITSAMAIQAVGGVLVPIYPASTSAQAAYVATHAEARVLFVGSQALLERVLESWGQYAHVERLISLAEEPLDPRRALAAVKARGFVVPGPGEVEARLVTWAQALEFGAARDAAAPNRFEALIGGVTLDQVAQLLYTSGTSGDPKGVPLTHRNVAVNGRDWLTCNATLLEAHDVDLLWLPMSHIFGFGEACLGNTLGWLTYLAEPAQVLALLPEVRPEVFMSVPAVWEKLAALASAEVDRSKRADALTRATGGNLRFCLSGGAGLKREVKEVFLDAGLLIIEGYGLTETSPTLTLNRPDAYRFDSVGKALPSVELRLAEDGEILARGPSVFAGYHRDPGATAEAFTSDGWLKTGDVGRFTEDGFLQIVDRKKDILVTAGGKNVPPANLELRFRDDPFITHAVVYGDGRKYLVAALWIDQAAVGARLERDQVAPGRREEATTRLIQERVDLVNAQLASFETIKRFTLIDTPLTVESGLLTSTLKVRRKAVYAAFLRQLEALYG